jgi:hypothetical protein
MKSYWVAKGLGRCIYEIPGAPLTYRIPDDRDRDSPRNVGSIPTLLAAHSPKELLYQQTIYQLFK